MFLPSALVFLSAFLLFQVQFMIAKLILPWYGGSTGVWTTSMLFFQVFLMLGYLYSHIATDKMQPHKQKLLHYSFMFCCVLLIVLQYFLWSMPLLPDASWKPHASDNPILKITILLSVTVGLPFLLLSSTSSMIQAVYSRQNPDKSPYFLYSYSNAGSLLGLISYPVAVEPFMPLKIQAWIWSAAFMILILGLYVLFSLQRKVSDTKAETPEVNEASHDISSLLSDYPALGKALWLMLPLASSILLLATTNQITQDIASIPFLWALPLIAYLLSFILCFKTKPWYSRTLFIILSFCMACLITKLILPSSSVPNVKVQILSYCGALFTACMLCHGELYRLRPKAAELTGFYLNISIGGALGGIFVAVLAPLLFNWFWELFLGYIFCAVCIVTLLLFSRLPVLNGRYRILLRSIIAAYLLLIFLMPLISLAGPNKNTIHMTRNFYGVLQIAEYRNQKSKEDERRVMLHSNTLHGMQMLAPEFQNQPRSYYTEHSGIVLAIRNHTRRLKGENLNIGIIGLGTGSLAAFGQSGDVIKFYEINPDIIKASSGDKAFFTHIKNSQAAVNVISGDARLLLEREKAQGFDILAVDAFSGDSIPVHLLTIEAFELYLRHLKPDGLLVIHISNRFIKLKPVVTAAAQHLNMKAFTVLSFRTLKHTENSSWTIIGSNNEFFSSETISSKALKQPTQYQDFRIWTDDYSNILSLLFFKN